MNTLALLLGLLLCLTMVTCRSFDDRREADPISEVEDEGHKNHVAGRHRRKRWQMNYGYDYPMPPYYPERRDYDRNQQDLLPKIVRLLEEISAYVKRPQPPPPPPQPIYIPYPIPYPVLQYAPCTTTGGKQPNITTRFPDLEDTNQNWGLTLEDDKPLAGDGSRPLSFDPIKPLRPMKRPAPPVDHGSVQSNAKPSTEAPKIEAEVGQSLMPVMCNAAVLSCCADASAQQRQCFNNLGCGESYDNGKACDDEAINAAIAVFKSKYGINV